jgi:hypothetical protein
VKLVYLVLLANGVPAFVILMSAPGYTNDLFVWTIEPEVSARLLGVMYGNALLLAGIGLVQPNWARARITLVVIAFFSVAATLVTLTNLGPFLNHPWHHLAYWLAMYSLLFFLAPTVLFLEERANGGRLLVTAPLGRTGQALALSGCVIFLAAGIALLVSPTFMSDHWPWKLTPLVARIVGVWLTALGIAYGWAAWDGDRVRAQPIFIQGIVTGPALALLPIVHSGDVPDDAVGKLVFYLLLAAFLIESGLWAALRSRGRDAGAPR